MLLIQKIVMMLFLAYYKPSQKDVIVGSTEKFWCEPDSTYYQDGIESVTYKSKHFTNNEHLK